MLLRYQNDCIVIIMKMLISGKGKKLICIFIGLCLTAPALFSQQDNTGYILPSSLRRPERSEAPRYPSDLLIGEMGRGEAPEDAYAFARDVISSLMGGRRNAASFAGFSSYLAENFFDEIDSLGPGVYRM